jgi:GT2 family glycosyltransferase
MSMGIALVENTRGDAVAQPAAAPGSARMVTVDVDDLPGELDCVRAAGGSYSAAWVLALRRGHPLGLVVIDVTSAAIDGDELERRLRDGLGAAWQRRIPEEPPQELALPRATVVVPTDLGRPEQLLACVRRLSELAYADYDVVVVDNRRMRSGAEDVLEALRELPRVRVIAEPRPGISAARNRGVAAATGEIIAFTDDDVEVDRQWLRALGRRFVQEPEADVVTGLLVPKELETPAQIWLEQSGSWLKRAYIPLSFELAARGRPAAGALSAAHFRVVRRETEEGHLSSGSLYATGEFGNGANIAFRAGALRSVGGFDEALGTGTPTCGGEDLAMLIELLVAGRRLAYEPSAIVHHANRRELEELERQIGGYGVGLTAMLTALIWRDPRHLAGLLGMVPAALRSIFARSPAKQARGGDYPRRLVRAELMGMIHGPFAYARSRRAQRRWRA